MRNATAVAPTTSQTSQQTSRLNPFFEDTHYPGFAPAVCLISSKKDISKQKGTGFLIGYNLLMTCHHVLKDPDMARKCKAYFNYSMESNERSFSLDFLPPINGQIFDDQNGFFLTREVRRGDPLGAEKLDYTIIALKDPLPEDLEKYKKICSKVFNIFERGAPVDQSKVNIIHHPQREDLIQKIQKMTCLMPCNPSNDDERTLQSVIDALQEKVDMLEEVEEETSSPISRIPRIKVQDFCELETALHYEFHFRTYTGSGSSGAPIFDKEGKLLAIHRGTLCTTHNNDPTKEECKIGISMSAIHSDLKRESLTKKIKWYVRRYLEPSIIYMPNNSFPNVNRFCNSVCVIEYTLAQRFNAPDKRKATGFLIGKNILLTVNSVLSENDIKKKHAVFLKQKERQLNGLCFKFDSIFHSSPAPSQQSLNFHNLDFTIVTLEPLRDKGLISFSNQVQKAAFNIFENRALAKRGMSAHTIHHPSGKGCMVKELQQFLNGGNTVSEVEDNIVIHYKAEGLTSGSVGAPIFNELGEIIGMHQGRCSKHFDFECFQAISIYAITAHLEMTGKTEEFKTLLRPAEDEKKLSSRRDSLQSQKPNRNRKGNSNSLFKK